MATTLPTDISEITNLKGLTRQIKWTKEKWDNNADSIFTIGEVFILVSDAGRINCYVTDGISKCKDLKPLVEEVLTTYEKQAISGAFTDGVYVPATANSMVVHDASGKIDDASLKVVSDGKIVESYLSAYIADGKVLASVLPDQAKTGYKFVADIAARDVLTAEDKKFIIFVVDATADETVDTGNATYVWIDMPGENEANGEWRKIAESESLDVDFTKVKLSYENVKAAGAFMCDMVSYTTAPTIEELGTMKVLVAGTTPAE